MIPGPPRSPSTPFGPSGVRASIDPRRNASFKARFAHVAGPGLLIAVGYMDPGNWATDIEAGSRFGNALLWVVLAASASAILLQALSLRLGIVAGVDLARACRDRYSKPVTVFLWLFAEIAIVACDVAEVIGSALALHLVFDLPLVAGVAVTAFDTVLVLSLQRRGFRLIEAIVLALVATIGLCFAIEIVLVGPDWVAVARGLVPHAAIFGDSRAVLVAVGIVGATVMPHNLYLHSSIVQTRDIGTDDASRADMIRLSTLDTVVSLALAFVVNAAILVLAATAFHDRGHGDVTEIQDAYRLLDPVVGSVVASLLFGVALFASGQSSTLTGTIAGQIVLEGFLDLRIPGWQRRLITRALALVPALVGVWQFGEAGIGRLLVASQVVLAMQLPFAIWPLVRIVSDPAKMGRFAIGRVTQVVAWLLFAAIVGANGVLLVDLFG